MEEKDKIKSIAKKLYCVHGFSFRDIVKIVIDHGSKTNHISLSKLAKKEGWVKAPSKIPLDASTLDQTVMQDLAAIKERYDVRESLNVVVLELGQAVSKALTLKHMILDKTMADLQENIINPMQASRILANLGLSALNIGRMIGIGNDETLVRQPEEQNVTPDQIQIYLPSNGRDLS